MAKTRAYVIFILILLLKNVTIAQNIKPFQSGEITLSRKSIQSMSKDTSYSSCFISYFSENNKVNTYMKDDRIYNMKGSVILLNKEVYVVDDASKEYKKMKYNTMTGDADKYFIDSDLFNQQFIESSVPKIYDSLILNAPCTIYECVEKGDSLQVSLDKKMYAPHTLTQRAYVNKSSLQMFKYEMIFKSQYVSQYETLDLKSAKSKSNSDVKTLFTTKIDSLTKYYTLKDGEVSRFTKEPEKINYSFLTPEVVSNLEFKLPDNSKIKFNTIKKNILIVFWYSSCIPCVLKIPELNELSVKYKDKLEIIGVDFVEQDIPYIKDIISKKSIQYKVAIDEGRYLKEKFKINFVPSWFLFSQSGELIETNQNMKGEDFKTHIGKLIK